MAPDEQLDELRQLAQRRHGARMLELNATPIRWRRLRAAVIFQSTTRPRSWPALRAAASVSRKASTPTHAFGGRLFCSEDRRRDFEQRRDRYVSTDVSG